VQLYAISLISLLIQEVDNVGAIICCRNILFRVYVHEEVVTKKAEQLATVAPSQLPGLTAPSYRKNGLMISSYLCVGVCVYVSSIHNRVCMCMCPAYTTG
jgi:hypothetical protein